MPPEGSVTRLIGALVQGDQDAITQLWRRYFPRLVGLACERLKSWPRCAAYKEDVALEAFHSFVRKAERGWFPKLVDRDSLWRLLMKFTVLKASHLLRREGREKRGGLQTEEIDLAKVLSREPGPEQAEELAEELRRRLGSLGDPELEQVALWRMEEYSVEEIAAKLGCTPRTVKRKLHLIRTIWEAEAVS